MGRGERALPTSSNIRRSSVCVAIQERRILSLFKRKAHLFLDYIPADTDYFQWLGIMQHHGAPTRLIDFTWSPTVAAFFALESAKPGDKCAVWAIAVPKLWTTSF